MTARPEIKDFAKSLARVLEARDFARSKQESSRCQNARKPESQKAGQPWPAR